MAIEDIMEIKDTVSESGIIPFDKRKEVMNSQNQVEFLRTMGKMGLSQQEVMDKLFQMFNENPSRFTEEFGLESAEAIREFLGFDTQQDLENRGMVFRDDSSEIIGQNISMRPEDFAIGTLPTDQADQFENMMESFMKKQRNGATGEATLPIVQTAESVVGQVDFNPKDYREGYLMLMNNLYPDTDREIHEQEYDNWFRGGEGSEYYEDRKNRLLKLLSNLPDGGAGHESAEDYWMRKYPEQFDEEGNYIGKKEEKFTYTTDDSGMVWTTDTETGEKYPAGTEADRKKTKIKKKDELSSFRKILRDLIKSGKETGAGIVNVIKEELKNMYEDYTEKSPDYNPEFSNEKLNKTTEDYFPPQP